MSLGSAALRIPNQYSDEPGTAAATASCPESSGANTWLPLAATARPLTFPAVTTRLPPMSLSEKS